MCIRRVLLFFTRLRAFPSRANSPASLADWFLVSWELTDDELTSGQRVSETATPKSRPKPRIHATATAKQPTTPTVPSATPTFVANHSDSDEEMRDDDGEYTEEHQLTRIRRGRQVNIRSSIAKIRALEGLGTNQFFRTVKTIQSKRIENERLHLPSTLHQREKRPLQNLRHHCRTQYESIVTANYTTFSNQSSWNIVQKTATL